MGKNMERVPSDMRDLIRRRAAGDPAAEAEFNKRSAVGRARAAESRSKNAAEQKKEADEVQELQEVLDALRRKEAAAQQAETETISPDGDVLPPEPITNE